MISILLVGISGFVALTATGWYISTYNFFQATKEAIDTQMSNLVTEYERRVDLFLNLAKNVKSFRVHEKETLVQLTEVRSGLKNRSTQEASLKKIDSLLSGLNINVEAYPTLKANGLYENFMNEIRITEDRILVAKTGYNEVVREYETKRVTFPGNIVAKHHNFDEIEYYKTNRDSVSSQAPEINV